jgi:hypothetical protein
MLSTDGRPMEFTYGCEVKPQGPTPDGSMPLKYVVDHIGGVPTARLSGREAIEDYFTIDADRWLVYLRGGLRGSRRNWVALCPAYPEVRENWFMRLVRHALDAGADGIDLRAPDAHQRCMTWTERNFNPPMIEAYKARYGVDPSREPYDRAKFAQLGGEFYEQFLEQAAMLCHSKGKKVQHHIYNHRDATGQDRPSMNLYVDWRKWIDRGWVDEVTLKELFPSMPLFHEVMTKCREFDIKTHFCPYLNTLMGSQKWVGPDPEYRNASRDYKPALTDLIRHARQQGCDGMLLYEAGTFLTGMADETVQFMWEGIPQTLHAAMKQ